METLFGLAFGLIYIALIVVFIMGYWKTFTKAGQPGWACLIPIYNYLVMADIAKVSRVQVWKAMAVGTVGYVIFFYMTLANQGDSEVVFIAVAVIFSTAIAILFFLFPVYKGIAINFGQSVAFAWGLLLLNVIFFAILGLGSAKYVGNNSFTDNDILDAEI